MVRRLSLALVTMLAVLLVAAGPVVGGRKVFTGEIGLGDSYCEVFGTISWQNFPDKEYIPVVQFLQDGEVALEITGVEPVSGGTNSFETYGLGLGSSNGVDHNWQVRGLLRSTGKHERVVATSTSANAVTIACTWG